MKLPSRVLWILAPIAALLTTLRVLSFAPPEEFAGLEVPSAGTQQCRRVLNGPALFVFFCDPPQDPALLGALIRGRVSPPFEDQLRRRMRVSYGISRGEEDNMELQEAKKRGSYARILAVSGEDIAGWEALDVDARIAMITVLVRDRYFLSISQLNTMTVENLVERLGAIDWEHRENLVEQLRTTFQ